jgi:hypothetical protein
MACGVENIEYIVFFGETHEDLSRKYLPLPNGIPSADTIRIVLGQVQIEEKSNEITAIPALMEALDISGCIVTIDAQDIVTKKENHPEVYAEVRELFEGIGELSCSFSHYTEVTKDHGRIEKREAWLYNDLSWFAGRTAWTWPTLPIRYVPLDDRKQTTLDDGCGFSGR